MYIPNCNKVEKIRVCVETFRHDMRSIRALHTDKRTELGITRSGAIYNNNSIKNDKVVGRFL